MRSVCQEDRSVWWGLLGKDTQRDGLDLQIVQMVRACGACEGRNTLVGRVRSWRTLDAMLFGSYLYGHCGEGEVDSDFRISTLAALRKALGGGGRRHWTQRPVRRLLHGRKAGIR